MNLQLLPKDSNRVDYRTYESGIIYRQYLLNDNVFHFTLHPELHPEGNQLDFTGRYLVVITSVRGLETFYITPDGEENFMIESEEEELGADLEIEREVQQLLKEVDIEPAEPLKESDLDLYDSDENVGDTSDESIEGLEWLRFDPESLMPLISTAIKEFRAN